VWLQGTDKEIKVRKGGKIEPMPLGKVPRIFEDNFNFPPRNLMLL
jgi:hypothetical protein